MLGVAVLVLAFVIGIPIMLMSLGAVAAVLGTTLGDDAVARHAGSELIELNR